MSRTGRVLRETRETRILVEVGLDGTGKGTIETPIPFLTHMLDQVARHGLLDLHITASGDVHVDGHHTTEDLAITLGQAITKALGDKAGIHRYGSSTVPMDEARATVHVDLSGRPYFVWEVPIPKAKVGTFDSELCEVFFEGLCRGLGANLHVCLERGENLHHIMEACFKAAARALRAAVTIDARVCGVPSTKGVLGEAG